MVLSSLVQPFLHFLLHYGRSSLFGLRLFLTSVVQELRVTSVHSPLGCNYSCGGYFNHRLEWFDGSMYVNSWNPHNVPTFEAIGVSISMTLWAFLGLESACANSDAVENPEKNVPIAVLGGTLGAAVIYIVSTNVIAGIVPNLELANSTAPFGLAFAHMFDETIGKVIMGFNGDVLFRLIIRLAVHYCSKYSNLQQKKVISQHSSKKLLAKMHLSLVW